MVTQTVLKQSESLMLVKTYIYKKQFELNS